MPPKYTPTIPITPERTGGAGIGNLMTENRMPTANPASVAMITSFITEYPSFHSYIQYSDSFKNCSAM
ncbi:protein of unknown function [Vibrio tapetis subsp. tapetis]|uniref:Uncharacterized protein n=1 Tax=Vibrio tapetis subsp. tapetis TaxID=1671868 RepID=A0A2N8ZCD5_9VIBR|nr:protein of unknown function [Vibrio tapetis subsp. tapetis]